MHSGASVNAVTKSETNQFTGSVFEFVRDRRFNAKNPFAAIGSDGERVDDGLKRHQFGGTVGGPILTDRLFFFGAYQSTRTRQAPSGNIAWVPTAAMLAGDFTAFASPQCNAGRQIALRAPYVNNTINPRFSPRLRSSWPRCCPRPPILAGRSPGVPSAIATSRKASERSTISGAPIRRSSFDTCARPWMSCPCGKPGGNLLTTSIAGGDRKILAELYTLGETAVIGANMVTLSGWRTTEPIRDPCGSRSSMRPPWASTPIPTFLAR